MKDEHKTKEQVLVLNEPVEMRQRVAESETPETERKRVEQTLSHERDLMQALFENHPDFFYFKDSEARFHRVSKRFCDFFGLSMEDILGKTDLELFPEEVAEQTYSEDLHVVKTGTPLVNKEESALGVWVLTTKIPWFDKEGNIIGLFGISRDITERKRAEEELRASEAKYRRLVEDINDGYYVVTRGRKIAFANAKMTDIVGYELNELIGGDDSKIIPPEVAHYADKMVQEFDQYGTFPRRLEGIYMNKDGRRVPVDISVKLVDYEGQAALAVIVRDITERKRAEGELLRHSKQVEALHVVAQTVSETLDLEELLDNALEKVVEVLDTDTGFLYVLDVEEKALFLKAYRGVSEKIGCIVSTIRLSEAELEKMLQWKNADTPLSDVFDGTNLSLIAEAMEEDQGQAFAVVPLCLKGQLCGLIAVGSRTHREFGPDDIDLLTAIGNQIAVGIQNAQLLEEAQAKVKELEEAQEYLVRTERHRALAEMAAGVAHDFNNILAVILGRAQLTLEDVTEPKVKRSLKIIEESACDAAEMLRRLRVFSGTAVVEELEELDPNQVVDDALRLVETRREQRLLAGVQIDISTDLGEVSTIAGKATELREVLLNVIFNAMDAMPEGGSITIRTAQEDSWVVLSISDTGVGMTKEVQRKIFDPFFTTKGSQGSGLGLSTSLGIVAKHGGTVEVDSTLENGSTFRIRLPILTGTRGEGRGNNDSHATKSARILAVDDEPEVAEVLELMLRQLGYEATVVNNGQEALDAFFSGGYDLVISDVYMPGMSGQEVARAIKESTADVPVLLITGWALQIDALEVNVDGLIAKPFSKEILSHHITKVLDGKREG